MSAESNEQPVHQIVADGKVIYEGADWAQTFKDAAFNPDYGEIVVMIDGQPGARWSAPLSSRVLELPIE